jgi:hypothetical protein
MALEPPDGGGGGGGGSYKILYQRPDILVQGVSNVVEAVTVTALDGIYGVMFAFTRSTSSWEGGAVQAAASFYAGQIQGIAQHPHVQGLNYTQDTNGSGNLIDQMIVTVGTDDGEQEASFVWPLETIGGAGAIAKADAVFNQLMTVANSTGG